MILIIILFHGSDNCYYHANSNVLALHLTLRVPSNFNEPIETSSTTCKLENKNAARSINF